MPDDRRLRFGLGAPTIKIHVSTWRSIYDTCLRGTLGFGEAYVRGELTLEGDLEDALTALAGLYLQVGGAPLERLARAPGVRSLAREKHDIEHHYDLGDDFYRFYLDRKLQYSCGYFRTPGDSLDLAQEQKIAHTLRKLALRPGMRLLDIGCGWGHLMFQAAEAYGVECVGITLSDNQAAFIREQAAERRLPVQVRVMNYLELDERTSWERIVSVGMMCHIGEKRIDRFWDKVKALLAPGAVCLLHCIAKMRESPGVDPFVERHVFPGYWFNSLEGMTARAVARGLDVLDVENLRRHYAMTAHCWRKNFLRSYDDIKRTFGYDDRFMRTWEFYLASVVAGFRSGHMHLVQMVLSNGLQDDYPLTREHLYTGERAALGQAAKRSLRVVPLA
ncbi:MAG: class I SAM-dependent methyltransferase [Polyangiaceae bacterium]|nr:class I SAM-dependent methyltransferase [Polyangiaceae bacterium]